MERCYGKVFSNSIELTFRIIDKAVRGLSFTERGEIFRVRLLRLNYLVQPLDLPSGRIIGLHPIAQPCEQGRECRHVSAKIGRHIA